MAQAISETTGRCATKVFAFPRLFSIPPAGSPMDFVWLPHEEYLEAIKAYRKECYVWNN